MEFLLPVIRRTPLRIGPGGNRRNIPKLEGLAMTKMFPTPVAIAIASCLALAACGVNESAYDTLHAQRDQLQSQYQAAQQQIASLDDQLGRIRNAVRYTVNEDLVFRSGSWELSDDGQKIMSRIAQQLAPYQTEPIVINGYTDNTPIGAALRRSGVDSNVVLSERRAQAVMDFLSSHGVRANMMSAKGWGEANPVAPNTTAAGRAQNRRVEITFANASPSVSAR